MSESVAPVLADIVRLWLRGDPTLNEHFLVHKQAESFTINLNCSSKKFIVGRHYYYLPKWWYFPFDRVGLRPTEMEFFNQLKNHLEEAHNKYSIECGLLKL